MSKKQHKGNKPKGSGKVQGKTNMNKETRGTNRPPRKSSGGSKKEN